MQVLSRIKELIRQDDEEEAKRELKVLTLGALQASALEQPLELFEVGSLHDQLGLENDAVPYYTKALELGLSGDARWWCFLNLASTYRCLGRYEESRETFEKGLEEFPNNRAMPVFLAMTLHNLNEHGKAMEIMLRTLADTSSDPEIDLYKRAIAYYADKLDQTFR